MFSKKAIKFLTILCVLSLTACGRKEPDADNDPSVYNNLDFETRTPEDNTDSDKNPYEDYEAMSGYQNIPIDVDLDLDKALAEGEVPYSFEEHRIYKGKPVELRNYIHNGTKIPVQQTYFMTCNDRIQPFNLDGGTEIKFYTVRLEPGETLDLQYSFCPLYAPKGKEGITEIFTCAYPAITDKFAKVMSENTDVSAPYLTTFFGNARYELYIQADKTVHERLKDAKRNIQGEDSPNVFVDAAGKPENFTTGVSFGDPYTEKTSDNLIKMQVEYDPSKQLFARAHCYKAKEVRIFLLMDGELLPAFTGQYFADFRSEAGVVHNIPIDEDILPVDGKHIISGLIYYMSNPEDMDIDMCYPSLLSPKSGDGK